MSSCRQGLHTFGRGDYVTYMKHEGAELQAQPDVVVWGVCVHHASGGEGEGEGGEEGGGGGKTQGRKWLVLCEVGRDHCGPFFVGAYETDRRVFGEVMYQSFHVTGTSQRVISSVVAVSAC